MNRISFKPEVSIGALIHLAVLIVGGILFLNRVASNQKQILDDLRIDRARWERVEKYLSSKDPHYWEIIHRFDELQPSSLLRQEERDASQPAFHP
jgi:hypothetical protein